MSSDDLKLRIIGDIKRRAETWPPLEVIEYIKVALGDEFDQFKFVLVFKNAFPQVPLSICRTLSASRRFWPDGLKDDHLLREIEPWLPLISQKGITQH